MSTILWTGGPWLLLEVALKGSLVVVLALVASHDRGVLCPPPARCRNAGDGTPRGGRFRTARIRTSRSGRKIAGGGSRRWARHDVICSDLHGRTDLFRARGRHSILRPAPDYRRGRRTRRGLVAPQESPQRVVPAGEHGTGDWKPGGQTHPGRLLRYELSAGQAHASSGDGAFAGQQNKSDVTGANNDSGSSRSFPEHG